MLHRKYWKLPGAKTILVFRGRVHVVLLILLCLTITACGEDKADGEVDLIDHYVELSNGNTMHYYDVGDKHAKPLLMVHGYPTSAYLYRHIIQNLCGAEDSAYRCIAITHIGFGKSSCPGDGSAISPLYEVDQLDEFIGKMRLEKFAAIVHDWGGPIGTAAALRHSEKLTHLILLNTILRLPTDGVLHNLMGTANDYFSKPRPVLEKIYPSIISVVMQYMTTSHLSGEVRSNYSDPFNSEPGRCRVHASANLFSNAKKDEKLFDEIAAGLETNWSMRPALLIWGTDDPLLGLESERGLASFKRIQVLLPQADTRLIDGANHFLQEDKPLEISREILKFLSGAKERSIALGPKS